MPGKPPPRLSSRSPHRTTSSPTSGSKKSTPPTPAPSRPSPCKPTTTTRSRPKANAPCANTSHGYSPRRPHRGSEAPCNLSARITSARITGGRTHGLQEILVLAQAFDKRRQLLGDKSIKQFLN